MRLKVLLVDDEAHILRNLQAVIPWEAMDIEVAGAARNGEQALEIVRERRPDIILCDIRMPVMDGIRFLEALRESGSAAEVIMMTGYQDFSYVRSVIRYEVKDYILKPIDYEELAHTLERLADGLRERSLEEQSMQKKWRRVFDLAYEKVLYDLLVDLGGDDARSFLRSRDIEAEDLAFSMLLADVSDYSRKEHSWDEKERKLWNFAVQNVLLECMAGFGVSYSVLQVRSGEWCVLVERVPAEPFDRSRVREWADRLRHAVAGHLKLPIRVAMHPSEVSLDRLARAYKALQRQLSLTPAMAEGIIVPEKRRDNRDETNRLWDWIEEAVTGLKRCDRKRTEDALRELGESFRRLPETSSERVEPILHYLCLHLFREMRAMDVMTKEEEADVWSRIDRNTGIRETLAVIHALVDRSMDSVLKKKTSDVLMLSARDYIERSLSADLSIDSLAGYLGISGSYFSLLFKQHFGETFVEYVTKQRMEMAKSLLALSDKSVTQVGRMVGFAERRYFTRVFSKYAGMLPSEFRDRHRKPAGETDVPAWTEAGSGVRRF